jgi:hypothetical protein
MGLLGWNYSDADSAVYKSERSKRGQRGMSYLIDVKYEATKYRNSFAKDDLDGPHRAEQDFLAGARCATKFLLHELENVRDNYHENIFPPVTVSELSSLS